MVLESCPNYFQAHMVVVLTQLPLKAILRSADYTGRIEKLGTILGVFDIKYMPCTSIKGQILVDLVVEFAESLVENESKEHCMGEKSVGARTISVEGIHGWGSEPKRVWCGTSLDLT